MTSDTPVFGHYPICNAEISRAYVLVNYQKADETTGAWAECPACDDVVSPE